MTTATKTPSSDIATSKPSLRERIEAGEMRQEARRLASQARDAADGFVDYAKKNPFKVVGGAIAAGLLIGAMTRPGRRVGKRGGALAALATDAALAYGMKMLDRAGTAADTLSHTGSSTASKLARGATYQLDTAGDFLRDNSRRAGVMGRKAMREVRSRFTH